MVGRAKLRKSVAVSLVVRFGVLAAELRRRIMVEPSQLQRPENYIRLVQLYLIMPYLIQSHSSITSASRPVDVRLTALDSILFHAGAMRKMAVATGTDSCHGSSGSRRFLVAGLQDSPSTIPRLCRTTTRIAVHTLCYCLNYTSLSNIGDASSLIGNHKHAAISSDRNSPLAKRR
jgi:hypothetical protein